MFGGYGFIAARPWGPIHDHSHLLSADGLVSRSPDALHCVRLVHGIGVPFGHSRAIKMVSRPSSHPEWSKAVEPAALPLIGER